MKNWNKYSIVQILMHTCTHVQRKRHRTIGDDEMMRTKPKIKLLVVHLNTMVKQKSRCKYHGRNEIITINSAKKMMNIKSKSYVPHLCLTCWMRLICKLHSLDSLTSHMVLKTGICGWKKNEIQYSKKIIEK